MPWPTTFAKLAAGNQLLALFDAMFAQIAQMVAVPCTAAGTNAITLTPIGNAPAFTSYQNFTAARFVATANNTAATTAQFGALGFLNVYLGDLATQVVSGGIVLGQEYVLIFVQSLNAGVGGFVLEQASIPTAPGFVPVPSNLTTGTTYTTPTAAGGIRPLYLHIRMVGGGAGGGTNFGANPPGGTGGTTTFAGGTWTAVGGSGGGPSPGGTSAGPGGAGGSGGLNGSGILVKRLTGEAGAAGKAFSGAGPPGFPGGFGGSTPFGGRGRGGPGTGGAAKANTGSGGAGGADTGVLSGGGGGASEYVEFIIPTPAASYTYAIGAGGAGSTGGGANGGAGAAGRIVIVAHWQ